MANFIKDISAENKKLISNFFSLSVLQVFNLVLPLLIIPYVLHMYGVEVFGTIILAQSLMIYFKSITDYGFSLTAVREISLARDDKFVLNEIFNKVVFSKIFLIVLSVPLLIFAALIQPKLNHYLILVIMSLPILIGQALMPSWFFQGIEKMHFLTAINFIAKLLAVILIFSFLKAGTNPIWVNFIIGSSDLLAGLFGLAMILKNFGFQIRIIKFSVLWQQMKEGWSVFVSNFAATIYGNCSIFILGFFATPIVVGYYSIAEKLYTMIRTIIVVFFQVTYPHVCAIIKSGHDKLIKFYKKEYLVFMFGLFVLCGLLFAFRYHIASFLVKDGNVGTLVDLIKFLAFGPILIALNVPFYQTLVAYNYKNAYRNIYIIGMLFSIVVNSVLAYFLSATGTVLAILLTEALITILFVLKVEINTTVPLFTKMRTLKD